MLMIGPHGLVKEKSYCENTTKPANSFSFHDPNNATVLCEA